MNILFLSNKSAYTSKSYGGAESSLQLMAEKFSERGHTVHYVTRSCRVSIKKVKINNLTLHVFPRSRGAKILKFIKVINNLILRYYLKRLIIKKNIEIVYCFYEENILRSLIKIKNGGPTPKLVMRMAGLYWYEKSKKSNTALQEYQSIFNSMDSVNYIHKGLKDLTECKLVKLNMNVNFKNTFNLDIGSSFKYNRDIDYLDLKNKEFRIIMATRFSNYQKRQDILVKAIALIDNKVNIRVKLIGDGTEREKVQKMINDLNIEDRVVIVPFMEQQKLWQEMQKSDLLCHACDYEGLGKIIIESMAMGLPVLASRVKPLSDYIEDGVNGFLVDNKPKAWANKIQKLINQKTERIKVSQESIKFIEENFNPDKNIKKYEKKFKEIIKN
ncbi:MAG: glycosyltransferase family 4 protein [Eubacteriales bacterium]